MKELTKNNLNTRKFWEGEAKKGYLKNYLNSPLSIPYVETIREAISPEDEVLDVACGSGVLTKYFTNAKRVVGCDFSQESVDFVHSVLGIETFWSDLSKGIKAEDKSFDVIVCTEVLEHLTNPKKALKEMARVARRKIIVSVPYDNGEPQSEEHKWLFSVKDIAEMLKPYGTYTVMVETMMSRIIGIVELPQTYIVDADDFCEGNDRLQELMLIKNQVPDFKITLFTIPGLCSKEFLDQVKQIEWIDMVPHGWLHPDPLEAQNWSYEESTAYLDKVEPLGLTKGFKAPGWQISDGMYQALLERGYWVADKDYNNDRRPKELKHYLLDDRNKLHFHIGHMGGHNPNEIGDFVHELSRLKGKFQFIKDTL